MKEGVVVRIDAKLFHVDVDGSTYKAIPRGKLYEGMESHEKRPIAVGDKVLVTLEEGNAVIEQVLPRKNRLSRLSPGDERKEQVIAANIDQVAVVVSIARPVFYPLLVDRILVSAEKRGIPPFVVINKIDLDKEGKAGKWEDTYKKVGYDVVLTSARTARGLKALEERLKGKITAFAGPSGAGKSSLLNALEPGLGLKTGPIGRSRGVHQGRHTTTHVQLLKLSFGGFVADTPGIRTFVPWDVEKKELGRLFIDFSKYIPLCDFNNCLHVHEPGCAVKDALEKGEIARTRYESYLSMLEELGREPWS